MVRGSRRAKYYAIARLPISQFPKSPSFWCPSVRLSQMWRGCHRPAGPVSQCVCGAAPRPAIGARSGGIAASAPVSVGRRSGPTGPRRAPPPRLAPGRPSLAALGLGLVCLTARNAARGPAGHAAAAAARAAGEPAALSDAVEASTPARPSTARCTSRRWDRLGCWPRGARVPARQHCPGCAPVCRKVSVSTSMQQGQRVVAAQLQVTTRVGGQGAPQQRSNIAACQHGARAAVLCQGA